MRELITLSILAAACWWMTTLDDATPGPDEARPGLGVGLATVLEGRIGDLVTVRPHRRQGARAVWFGMELETNTSLTLAGREEDLERVELTLWCYRGGTFGKPDRKQIAAAVRTAQDLLANVGAGGASTWVAARIEAFVQGNAKPNGIVVGGVRVRIHFEDRFDVAILRIDRAPEA